MTESARSLAWRIGGVAVVVAAVQWAVVWVGPKASGHLVAQVVLALIALLAYALGGLLAIHWLIQSGGRRPTGSLPASHADPPSPDA